MIMDAYFSTKFNAQYSSTSIVILYILQLSTSTQYTIVIIIIMINLYFF